MKLAEAHLGQLIKINNELWRIVRIVEESVLFERSILHQSYAQVMGEKGEIDFLIFEGMVENDMPFDPCPIKGLGEEWRVK